MSNYFKFNDNNLCKANLIENFDLANGNGFLPETTSIEQLSNAEFRKIIELSNKLPDLIKNKQVVATIDKGFDIDVRQLINNEYSLKSYTLTSLLSHAYEVEKAAFQKNSSPVIVPEKLAISLNSLAASLCRLPTQTYETYILQNYRLINHDKSYSFDNLEPLVTYSNTNSEKNFIKVHVMTEFYAGHAIQALLKAKTYINNEKEPEMLNQLNIANQNILEMNNILKSMESLLDPHEFFFNLRPLLKNYDKGVVFDSVSDDVLLYRGASGAQSSTLPAIDKLIGININQQEVMQDMLNYMPPSHQTFLRENADDNQSIREFISNQNNPELTSAYNDIVDSISNFRSIHFQQIIVPYIVKHLSTIHASTAISKPGHSCLNIEFMASELQKMFLLTKNFFVQNIDIEDKNAALLEVKQDMLSSKCNNETNRFSELEKEISKIFTSMVDNNKDCMVDEKQLLSEVLDINTEFALNTFGTAGMDFAHTLLLNIQETIGHTLTLQEYIL